MITAAPAALLAGATVATSPSAAKAESVTTDIWERWRQARAIADRDLKDEGAAEKRMFAGEITHEEFRAVEDAATVTWTTAFDLGKEAYITPALTAADVVGKARVVAWAVDVDDWGEQIDGDLVVSLLRDLAAARGVSAEVEAILSPAIAKRDGYRAKRDGEA